MTPYARHMALCVIVWFDPYSEERRQTPLLPRWRVENRLKMIRRFGKPLYLIRCHEWRRRPSVSEATRREKHTRLVN